jgi:hypothetical protein
LLPDLAANADAGVHRPTERTGGLGEGFQPQVAPLNSILEKLAARHAALEAK